MEKLLQSAMFPIHAFVFVFRIEAAYWGFRGAPRAAGWASILALLATGATALGLLRSAPDVGAALGTFGVLVAAYIVGIAVDSTLLAIFGAEHGQ